MANTVRYGVSPWLARAIASAKSGLAVLNRSRLACVSKPVSMLTVSKLEAGKLLLDFQGGRLSAVSRRDKNTRCEIENVIDENEVHISIPSSEKSGRRLSLLTANGKTPAHASHTRTKLSTNKLLMSRIEPSSTGGGSGAGEYSVRAYLRKNDIGSPAGLGFFGSPGTRDLRVATRPSTRQEEAVKSYADLTRPQSLSQPRRLPRNILSLDGMSHPDHGRNISADYSSDIIKKRSAPYETQTPVAPLSSPRASTFSTRNYQAPHAPSGSGAANSLGDMAGLVEGRADIKAGSSSRLNVAAKAGQGAADPHELGSGRVSIEGDVYLDGSLVGRWMERTLTRAVARPPISGTGFDPTRSRLPVGTMVGI